MHLVLDSVIKGVYLTDLLSWHLGWKYYSAAGERSLGFNLILHMASKSSVKTQKA